jgi:hypothetical protein
MVEGSQQRKLSACEIHGLQKGFGIYAWHYLGLFQDCIRQVL